MCTIEGCDREVLAKGLCNAHYLRLRKQRKLDGVPVKKRRTTCSLCNRKHYGHGFCVRHYIQNLRKIRWEYLIEKAGGCCQDCRKTFPYQVYDFHHLDPTKKELSISNSITDSTIEKLEKEVAKCVLLCSNCHRIRHARKL